MTKKTKKIGVAAAAELGDTPIDCLMAPRLGVEELAFRKAAAAFDDTAFAPDTKSGEWPFFAKPLFIYVVQRIREAVPRINLVEAQEFHAILWMMVRFGAEQNAIARDLHVSKNMVSRWVLAEQTPRADRRRGILMSALTALEAAIDGPNPPVPLRKLEGRRAEGTGEEPWTPPELNVAVK